jgi:hypothetical protein
MFVIASENGVACRPEALFRDYRFGRVSTARKHSEVAGAVRRRPAPLPHPANFSDPLRLGDRLLVGLERRLEHGPPAGNVALGDQPARLLPDPVGAGAEAAQRSLQLRDSPLSLLSHVRLAANSFLLSQQTANAGRFRGQPLILDRQLGHAGITDAALAGEEVGWRLPAHQFAGICEKPACFCAAS